jgi:hypothetical protein
LFFELSLLSLLLPTEFELCCDVEDDDDDDDGSTGPNDGEEGGVSVPVVGPSNSSCFTIALSPQDTIGNLP